MTWDSTYMWNCACGAEILVIRKGESSPLVKAVCPACQQVHRVSPKVRRESLVNPASPGASMFRKLEA